MSLGERTGRMSPGHSTDEPQESGRPTADRSGATRRPNADVSLDRRDVLGATAGGVVAGLTGVGFGAGASAQESGLEQSLEGQFDGCLAPDWPDPIEDLIDLRGTEARERGAVPESGDLIVYVHGFGSGGTVDTFTGEHQAAALEQALAAEGLDVPIVAAMWNAFPPDTTSAGELFADWLEAHADRYDRLVVFGHSMGAIVTAKTLANLADREASASLSSVGLLGAALDAGTVCGRYRTPFERHVEGTVYNYHTEGDGLVCEDSSGPNVDGLGCQGDDCTPLPENYVDVDLTGSVVGHCAYFQPATTSMERESGVPAIVDTQLADPFDLPRGTVELRARSVDERQFDSLDLTVSRDGPVRRHVLESESRELALPPGEYRIRSHHPFWLDTSVVVEDGDRAETSISSVFALLERLFGRLGMSG
jgi:pimeloyl-ACP methyl ester carboxylesterase